MLIAVHPTQHLHVARTLSPSDLELIHQNWPETMAMPRQPYLLNIPQEHGRMVGEMLSQDGANVLTDMWPELGWFLEQPYSDEQMAEFEKQNRNE